MVKTSIISKAVGEANKSTHYHKMGAVIFDKRYIISSGRNYPCKSTKHLLPKFKKWETSIHAEIDAVIKARKDLKGCSILIIRLVSNGFGMAKPCQRCLAYLDFIGIRSIYYSDSKGEIIKYVK